MSNTSASYIPRRSNQLLFKKFRQFLLPTMITYAAVSLNEFADSMLVSNLLDTDAMAIISLGMPVMLVMAAVYSLLGTGGETVYGIAIGRRDHETAGDSVTAALSLSLAAGVLLLVLGNIFFPRLAAILCRDPLLRPDFDVYLRALLLSSPFLIVIMTFVSFLPAAGYPSLATAVNVTVNVVNIILDYVYIRFFHMGVEGAAYATLTGYLCGAALLVITILSGRIRMHVSRSPLRSLRVFREIAKQGSPDAFTQIGFSMQFAVCNRLATIYGGTNAVVALSLCIQSNSFVSIFLASLIGASVPIMAVLHGQRDYRGESDILRLTMAGQLAVAAGAIAVFELFAPRIAALYNIREPAQAALAVHALRIYILMYLFRSTVIVYFRYLRVIGLTTYAAVISALDGFAAIIPIAICMTFLFGIDGLWFTFPLTALLILLLMVVCNRYILLRSGGRFRGILLFEHDTGSEPVLDVTITKDTSSIAGLSEKFQQICEQNGLDRRKSLRAALALEEIAVYAANRKRQDAYMDVLVHLYREKDRPVVQIDVRNLGAAFDPLADDTGDIEENVLILRSVASRIENEYLVGMNSTRIIIEGSAENTAS